MTVESNVDMRVLAWVAFKTRHLNPYNALLYDAVVSAGVAVDEFSPNMVLRRSYNVFHLHWPDHLLNRGNLATVLVKSAALFSLMDIARARGAKVVWTVHNLHSHEHRFPRIERMFWRQFLRRVDGFISLTKSAHQLAIDAHPGLKTKPGFIVPHGHYRGAYANSGDREGARRALGIAGRTRLIVFVGSIRPYKNVPALIQRFRSVQDADVRLLIAGKVSDADHERQVYAAAAGDSRVVLRTGFVADPELDTMLNAADLVVLPFREILNSGSSLLALSFNRPILVPSRGSFAELQKEVGPEWVMTYDGDLTREHLTAALEGAARISPGSVAPLAQLDWSHIGAKTIQAYRSIVGSTASAA